MAKTSKQATRGAILEAARTVLASDGPEALSVSKVAHLAGINRGTAYQHFKTREDLIKATVESVSEQLLSIAFSGVDPENREDYTLRERERDMYRVIAQMVEFAVENPNLGRIWLFELLSSDDPSRDRFFRYFKNATQSLADTGYSQDGIDVEALSVIVLGGYFLWSEWVRARANTDEERKAMGDRMTREMLRLFLHGVVKTEDFPGLEEQLKS
ncbi:TetR/AcrR family transcriptional regulator [Pseudomaricurvus sp. HS19]|uniref:TetR/AcrR family transcriptional regulator n=1 Tax=Pseudomaricurvus sp. HS19 TaxID=2692626 RepID=UPI001367BB92|nr:TetR/AcrR family transcriptional regulator [Pseudomaricurvus sp. HS19]MYM62441.1 TetR family transcriptional regulator [Pseudomaricurvus sp. HS19]